MLSVNEVRLLGHVGSEPDIRTTGGGKKLAKFSLATSRVWQKDGQKHEKTEWHRITAWDKDAEFVERYINKGDGVFVAGSIEYSQTESDGHTRYWTDIVAQRVILCHSRNPDEHVSDEEVARHRPPDEDPFG